MSDLKTNLQEILQDKNTNLKPENLKAGITCLGITGTMGPGIDTSDADAVAGDIAKNKTAYVNGKKITGTINDIRSGSLSISTRVKVGTVETNLYNTYDDVIIRTNSGMCANNSLIAEGAGLTPEKIVAGNTILGVEGTYEGDNIDNYFSLPSETSHDPQFSLTNCIKSMPLLDTSNVDTMSYAFAFFPNLETIPQLDTSNVTNMSEMFYENYSLTSIPLLDTTKVTNMYRMFYECNSLTSIPILNTSKVIYMEEMFAGCTSLTTVPLLNTSNVTTMNGMFNSCTSLTSVPLLDTSKVTTMSNMFAGCTSLTTIPLLNTSKVTSIIRMFTGCTSLSNDSLNNILAMLTNATSYTGTKTLKYIGLSETQSTTCTTLSNWSACEAAGWTTGY